MNQALAFIKPHVMKAPTAAALIESRLAEAGIAIVLRRELDGAAVVAGGFIDRHYAAIARGGLCVDAATLALSAAAQSSFAAAFNTSWRAAVAAGRVVGGEEMRRRLGVDGETLHALWLRERMVKLAGGLYAVHFREADLFVLNGFYPSMRAIFMAPSARLRLLLLRFDEQRLPWRRFRDEIVGATDPAAAAPASIRGEMRRRAEELGIVVSNRENAIHASASAFESLAEQLLWLPDRDPADDPLWRLLRGSGLTAARLATWREENPQVTLGGVSGALLDLLENRDTNETAALLFRYRDGGACSCQRRAGQR